MLLARISDSIMLVLMFPLVNVDVTSSRSIATAAALGTATINGVEHVLCLSACSMVIHVSISTDT